MNHKSTRNLAILGISLLASGCLSQSAFSTSAMVGSVANSSSAISGGGGAPTGHVTLTWGANAGEQTGFVIEQSSDGANFSQVQSVTDGTTQATVTGLNRGGTYYFRIRSYNPAGSSAYSPVLTANIP